MIELKYSYVVSSDIVLNNLKRLTNQIYKLLPMREEGADWGKPLATIIVEIAGMNRLFFDQQPILFTLLCKLEGLFTLTEAKDFDIYRGAIFECLSLLSELKTCLAQTI